mmetsp:Transcript_35940/g.70732  ORF Transcript_35940/g.70732 Transcript_35940/m.70732 type:complete len:130 (-) Transcript_35940:539-928(-)
MFHARLVRAVLSTRQKPYTVNNSTPLVRRCRFHYCCTGSFFHLIPSLPVLHHKKSLFVFSESSRSPSCLELEGVRVFDRVFIHAVIHSSIHGYEREEEKQERYKEVGKHGISLLLTKILDELFSPLQNT